MELQPQGPTVKSTVPARPNMPDMTSLTSDGRPESAAKPGGLFEAIAAGERFSTVDRGLEPGQGTIVNTMGKRAAAAAAEVNAIFAEILPSAVKGQTHHHHGAAA